MIIKFITGELGPKPVLRGFEEKGYTVVLQANYGNSGYVYIAFDENPSSDHYIIQLKAGDAYILDDFAGDIYALADTANDILSFGRYLKGTAINRRVY